MKNYTAGFAARAAAREQFEAGRAAGLRQALQIARAVRESLPADPGAHRALLAVISAIDQMQARISKAQQ